MHLISKTSILLVASLSAACSSKVAKKVQPESEIQVTTLSVTGEPDASVDLSDEEERMQVRCYNGDQVACDQLGH